LLIPKIKSYLKKSLVVLIALLIIFYIGFSRLYVGDHYLTDIISGYAIGIAWFGLAITCVELMFKKSSERKNGNEQLPPKKRGMNK
jgi:undecaprenyl-diphosphatase